MQSYKWLHLYVFFNCLLKLSAWTDAKSHWLHLYAFLQSEFSNVSSNCLPVQMQSRIGCICMLFQMSPQIVCPTRCKVEFIAFVCFSQVTFQMCLPVSSDCLPEQMQSRIYCICMLFSSDYSNVSPNCLPVQMHSSIGCICAFFLQSEFLNVSSNCLPVQMHSSIDCIWTIFHLREFSDVYSNRLPE